MTERKLASIQKITKLSPIKDADKIEVAHINGWKVVVQKGIHKEGDLVVYFEIDSLLPEKEVYEFLRDRCYVKASNSVNGAGFRLKTIKLRGQVSQGMIMPISALASQHEENPDWWEFHVTEKIEHEDHVEFSIETHVLDPEEGDDLTTVLGVQKYEKPIPANLAGKIRGNFPSFIPKTDQERIQNFIPHFMKKYRDHEWEVSLKLDGSSMTVYYYAPEDRFGVCSRNLDLTETEDNSFWRVARKLDLENKMRDVSGGKKSFAIQGELMGPGVQGNRENLKELTLYVYDIWDVDNHDYLPSNERIALCDYLDIHHVPVYEIAKMGYDDADGFLQLAEFGYDDGRSLNHKEREGLVFKSIVDPSVSFKAISNKYLLSGND